MIEKYLDEQYLVTTLLSNSLKNNKIVQAYMFSSNDIKYILNFAKDFAKDLICINMDEIQKINTYQKIDNNMYDELKIIEPINNMIKKEQFLSLKNEIKTKPVEGNKIVYVMKNCEKLNIVTANAMLKFIEEANDDVIAIFLTDNIDMVIPTIKSRCQILNFENKIETLNTIEFLKKNIQYSNDEQAEELITLSIEYILSLEKNKINTYFKLKQLIYDKFKENMDINLLIITILYFYYDILNYKISNKIKYMSKYDNEIKEITEKCMLDNIIKKIYILEEIKKNNIYNLNQKLLIDKMTLKLSEV